MPLIFMGSQCTPIQRPLPGGLTENCMNVYVQCDENGCYSRNPAVDASIRRFQQQISRLAPGVQLTPNGVLDDYDLQVLAKAVATLLQTAQLTQHQRSRLEPLANGAVAKEEIARYLADYEQLLASINPQQGLGQPSTIQTPYSDLPTRPSTPYDPTPYYIEHPPAKWVLPALIAAGVVTVGSVITALVFARRAHHGRFAGALASNTPKLSPAQARNLEIIRARGSVVKRRDFLTKGLHMPTVDKLIKMGLVRVTEGEPYTMRVGRAKYQMREKIYTAVESGVLKSARRKRAQRAPKASRNVVADPDPLAIADYEARDFLVRQAEQHGARFGTRKVFLSTIPGLDLRNPEHLRVLDALRRDGLIRLARADLVAAMDPKLVRASEVNVGPGQFHFLELL